MGRRKDAGSTGTPTLPLRDKSPAPPPARAREGGAGGTAAPTEIELALRESEERFRQLADHIDHVFYVTDLQPRRLVYLSPGFERVWGRPRDWLMADPGRMVETIHPEDRAHVASFEPRQLRGEPIDITYRILRADGAVRWIRDRAFPVGTDRARSVGFAMDVTEQKEAEDLLRESEGRLRLVQEAGRIGSFEWNVKTGAIHRSREYLQLQGLPDDSGLHGVYTDAWLERVHPDDREQVQAWFAADLRRGGPYERQYRIVLPTTGETRWILNRGRIDLDEAGQAVRLLSAQTDITRHKQAEDALREQAAELRAILDAAPAAIWIARDPQARRVDGNAVARRLLRAEDGANLSKTPDDPSEAPTGFVVVDSEGRELAPENLPVQRAARGEVIRDFEETIIFEDGEKVHLIGNAAPLTDAQGRQRGAVASFIDVTERKQTAEALRESEARFRNLADHAPVMVWVTDPTGFCTYLNRAWYAFTGQTEAEAEGFGWLEATHPDDKASAGETFLRANEKREAFRLEYRLRRADGAYRWCIDAAAPRFSRDGEFLGYVGSVIDIDERREAEERLRESETRLRTVMDVVPAFIWFAEPDGRLLYFNDRWYEYTGQTPDQALPDGWAGVLHPDDAERTAREWAAARSQGASYEIEVRYRRRDGEYRWYQARAEPRRGPDGAIQMWFGASTDIHDAKMAEAALRESEARLRTLTDNLPAAMVYQVETSADMLERRYTYVSANCEAFMGVPAQEALADPQALLSAIASHDRPRVLAAEQEAARTLTMLDIEIVGHLRDGRRIVVQVYSRPRRLPGGRLIWDGLLLDVTARRSAEDRLQRGLDAGRMVAWELDIASNTVARSANADAVYGEGSVAEDFTQRIHPEDAPADAARFQAALAGETPGYVSEYRYRRPDGAWIWIRNQGQVLRDPTGRAVRAHGVAIDITDRRAAEEALRESEGRLRFLGELDEALRASRDAAAAMLSAARLLALRLGASRCAYADVDADSDRFIIRDDYTAPGVASSAGVYSLDLFGPRAAADMRRGRTLVVRDVAQELRAGEGREMFLAIGISAIVCCPLIKNGRLAAMMALHQEQPRDWRPEEVALVETVVERCWAHVERIGAEARLRESEARYRTLFEAIDAGFCIVEMKFDADMRPVDYRLAEVNPAFERQTGLFGAAGKWVSEAAPGLERHWFETYGRVALTGEPARFENYAEPFGRWYDVYAFRTGSPLERRVAILFNDITPRRAAEQRLRELNEKLEVEVAERTRERDRIYTLSQDLFTVCGFDGNMRAANPAWSKVLGLTEAELLARPYMSLVHREDYESTVAVVTRLAQGEPISGFEHRLVHANGSLVWINWTAVPEGELFYAIGRDITRDKEREEAVRQGQKLEAIGQLTGGIAHDFNNLLGALAGNLDLIRRKPEDVSKVRRWAQNGLDAAERGAKLTGQLLAFSRAQKLERRPVLLGPLVLGMQDLLERTLGSMVRLHFEIEPGPLAALSDKTQLEMAVLNLAINGRDAMPDGGDLFVRLSARRLADDPELAPGDYVELSVTDTGTGMSGEVAARAFEPFFTTKGPDRGTGLGLSQVYGVARQAGGAARIDSRVGRGTTVRMLLRRADADPPGAASEAVASENQGILGRVLVIDDNAHMRRMLVDGLEALGYDVTEAEDGKAGLERLREAKPDVMLVDFAMPGLNGAQVAQQALALHPTLPIVFVTGYSDTRAIEEAAGARALVLRKPFRVRELQAAVAGALAATIDEHEAE
jgi:PAS domain S-box-containing protein